MYISNPSLLPFGWTAETLMEPHASKPYNPSIAKVFYRAGYIESWGRGIQKICDACQKHGSEPPRYILHGEDIMVEFKALPTASTSIPLNRHDVSLDVSLELRLLELLTKAPDIKAKEAAEMLSVTDRSIYRALDKLKADRKIERIGGKRFGHWEIKE